jgi:hypothetical protein
VDLGCGHGEVLLAAHAAYPECRVVSELLRNIAKIWLRYVYTCIVYGSIYVYITYIYMSIILYIYVYVDGHDMAKIWFRT